MYVLLVYVFVYQVRDDEFSRILDRVATTKDFAVVRDNILLFIKVTDTLVLLRFYFPIMSCRIIRIIST